MERKAGRGRKGGLVAVPSSQMKSGGRRYGPGGRPANERGKGDEEGESQKKEETKREGGGGKTSGGQESQWQGGAGRWRSRRRGGKVRGWTERDAGTSRGAPGHAETQTEDRPQPRGGRSTTGHRTAQVGDRGQGEAEAEGKTAEGQGHAKEAR